MAGTSAALVNVWFLLFFQATAIANICDNAATSPITTVSLSLHTATPAAGNQTTSEATYSGYARISVNRNSGSPGFGVVTNVATLSANAVFGTSTGTPSETETFLGIGKSSSGTGLLGFYGGITPSIVVTSAGVTPTITNASTVTGT